MSTAIQSVTAFLISFDNGQHWEDHWVNPVCLVRTRAEAERLLSVSRAWVDTARAGLPEADPMEIYSSHEGNEDEAIEALQAADTARSLYIAQLVPPFGLSCLVDTVDPDSRDCHGHLTLKEVPWLDISPLWPSGA